MESAEEIDMTTLIGFPYSLISIYIHVPTSPTATEYSKRFSARLGLSRVYLSAMVYICPGYSGGLRL